MFSAISGTGWTNFSTEPSTNWKRISSGAASLSSGIGLVLNNVSITFISFVFSRSFLLVLVLVLVLRFPLCLTLPSDHCSLRLGMESRLQPVFLSRPSISVPFCSILRPGKANVRVNHLFWNIVVLPAKRQPIRPCQIKKIIVGTVGTVGKVRPSFQLPETDTLHLHLGTGRLSFAPGRRRSDNLTGQSDHFARPEGCRIQRTGTPHDEGTLGLGAINRRLAQSVQGNLGYDEFGPFVWIADHLRDPPAPDNVRAFVAVGIFYCLGEGYGSFASRSSLQWTLRSCACRQPGGKAAQD